MYKMENKHILEVLKLARKNLSICHISVKQTLQSVRQTEIIFNQNGAYKRKLMKFKKKSSTKNLKPLQ